MEDKSKSASDQQVSPHTHSNTSKLQSNNFQSVEPDSELSGLSPLSFFLRILQAERKQ